MPIPSLDLTARLTPPITGTRRPLLTPLAEPGHFLMVIDNSSAEKFTTCPQAAYNYLVLGREAHARNAALTFGGAIHAGLECLLKNETPEVQDAAIVRHFTDHPAPPDPYRTVETALEVLHHYRFRATLPDYAWTILSDETGSLIERAFELPLGVVEVGSKIAMPWQTYEQAAAITPNHDNLGAGSLHYVSHIHIAWSGRIDAIAHVNNANRVVDHKTTSIAGDQVIQDFQLSNQTIGYVWAAQQLYPQHAVSGFCVNFIHLKKPTGKGLSLVDKGPRGGEPALNFFRAFFDYSPERIAWWHDNVMTICEDFIACLVRNRFPSHTKWCMGKYGPCPYHVVCTEDDANVRKNLINADNIFRPVTWNPVRP